MLSREWQLLQFRGDDLERLVEAVLTRVDTRLIAAFKTYMGGAEHF